MYAYSRHADRQTDRQMDVYRATVYAFMLSKFGGRIEERSVIAVDGMPRNCDLAEGIYQSNERTIVCSNIQAF